MHTKDTPALIDTPQPATYHPIVYQPIVYQPAPYQVAYQRPRPRIAKGIFVLLVSGLVGLIIFAMGQTVWGAIWRSWIVTAIIIVVALLVL